MEVSHHQTRPDEPELDLYTIPSQSSWFVWDEIHETERVSLREFFDESSITRTPKIYKEYRDFIINKYREEPSRRLSFTEVRKSLVGDVNLLRKVFVFLENRGLINYSAAPAVAGRGGEEEERSRGMAKVRVSIEEGVPNGIRVAAMPNSMKPITPPETSKDDPVTSAGGGGVKLPPLASFSDVFADLIKVTDVPVCGNCGERCNSGQYKYTKGDSSICVKCFESKNYGENKTIDDYKFTEVNRDNASNNGASWTEAETLLLLDSVLKHGEDWNLVAQSLPTKTKPDCISKIIELPFGDYLRPKTDDSSNDNLTGDSNLPKNEETVKINDQQNDENLKEIEQNGDSVEQDPPLKRQRIDSFLGPGGGSLMEQVSRLTTMVDPQIAAAAAEAAISSLCEENSWPREIFDYEDNDDDDDDIEEGDFLIKDLQMRDADVENSEVETKTIQPENPDKSTKDDDEDSKIPLTLRIRTAVATALGSAAAHAKLLADQEEREIENLMATIISTEVKKLHCKMKSFEYLEAVIKKKRAEIEETESILLSDRVEVLKEAFKAGVSTWKNHSDLKP